MTAATCNACSTNATMRYGRIPGLDKEVSRLVQGTMMLHPDKQQENFELLDALLAMGCNTFDLAHGYGGGGCDRVFGAWLESRGQRERVVVLEKGAHHNADRKRVTPFDIASDLHDSLARLRTDYVDVYVLHRDNPAVPVGPIVDALNHWKDAGKIRIFGGSNWTHTRIQEANEYAQKHGLEPFRVSSPNYSLAVQVKSPWGDDCISISGPANAGVRAWYAQEKFPLFTWSSLARGFFSGRYTRENYEAMKSTPDASSVHAYCCEENFQRLDRVAELAREKGLTIPQIAMAYVANQPLNIFALIGCYTPQEFRECLQAAALELSSAELAWLNLERVRR